MPLSTIIKAFKMFYLLLCYVTSLFSLACHLVWLFCTMASTGIPWATFLLIIVCIGSKFVKLKSPCNKYLHKLFGDDNSCELSKTLFWPIAHRGASFDAPENSAAALKKVNQFLFVLFFIIFVQSFFILVCSPKLWYGYARSRYN